MRGSEKSDDGLIQKSVDEEANSNHFTSKNDNYWKHRLILQRDTIKIE